MDFDISGTSANDSLWIRNLQKKFLSYQITVAVNLYNILSGIGKSEQDWTLEDNVVNGLFFCATLASRRGGHTVLV